MYLSQIARVGTGLFRARMFGAHIPLAVWIDVTNRCPAGCAYCEVFKSGKGDIPLPGLLRLMDELRELGCVRLHLTGGDPLIRDDIGEIIDHARRHNFLLTLSTREHFVPKRIADLEKIDMLFLSFEGEESVHDELKGKGSFRALMDAFALLRQRKVKFLTTTTLTKRNVQSVPFILETARRYGFVANFQCLHYPLTAASSSGFRTTHPLADLLLTEEEHRAIGRKLLGLRRAGFPIATSAPCLRYIFLEWKNHQEVFLPHRLRPGLRCWAGRLFCQIDVEGFVYPCGSTFERGRRDEYLNALDVGFGKAFAHLASSPCQACLQACHVELNLLFSLDIGTLWHWFRTLVAPRGRAETGDS